MKLFQVHHYPLPAYGLISAIIVADNGEMAGHIFEEHTERHPLPYEWDGIIKATEIGLVTDQDCVLDYGIEKLNRESFKVEGYIMNLNIKPAPHHTVPQEPGRSGPDITRILKDDLMTYVGRGRKGCFGNLSFSISNRVDEITVESVHDGSDLFTYVTSARSGYDLFDVKDNVWIEQAVRTESGFKIQVKTVNDWREDAYFKIYEGGIYYAWFHFNNVPTVVAEDIVTSINNAVQLANE